MKTLLEKLKPEILKTIESKKESKPATMENILKELNNTFFVIDLKYSIALDTMSLYRETYNEVPFHAWDCFVEEEIK